MFWVKTIKTTCRTQTKTLYISDKDIELLIKIISKIIDNPNEKKFRFVTISPRFVFLYFQFFNFMMTRLTVCHWSSLHSKSSTKCDNNKVNTVRGNKCVQFMFGIIKLWVSWFYYVTAIKHLNQQKNNTTKLNIQ